MRLSVRWAALASLCAAGSRLAAQTPAPAATTNPLQLKHAPAPTVPAITPADLMTRLYIYADDSMMGRQAGTEWNLKATAYVADQVRHMGLQPGGDSGSFFQDVPLVKSIYDSTSSLSVDGVALEAWRDFIPRDQSAPMHPIDGVQAVYAGVWGDSAILAPDQAAGKLVVVGVPSGVGPNGRPQWFVSRLAVTNRYRSAAGIAVASMDYMPEGFRAGFRNPNPILKGGPPTAADTTPLPSYLYLTAAAARGVLGVATDSAQAGTAGKTVHGRLGFVEVPAPARNVVAILPGGDPNRKGEYVAIGAHNDHIGFKDRKSVV